MLLRIWAGTAQLLICLESLSEETTQEMWAQMGGENKKDLKKCEKGRQLDYDSGQKPVMSSCEHGNEPSGSKKAM